MAADLRQIYCWDLIGEADNHFVVKEKQTDPNALASVTFVFAGHIIFVKNPILSKTTGIYNKDFCHKLFLTKNCDGALLLQRDEGNYLIYLEMKSGFSDVKKKAVQQLPASYLKLNSTLSDFTSFSKQDYKEFGLIISYPPKTDKSMENTLVMANKQAYIGEKQDMVSEYYSDLLKEDGTAIFNGKDFGMDVPQNVKAELLLDNLLVAHHPVTNQCVNATVDLDKLIADLASKKLL